MARSGCRRKTYPSAVAFLAGFSADRQGCLLVDMRMPGMSGLDLVEELKRRGVELPVIIMTGHTDERSIQRLKMHSPLGFLEKPFSVVALRELVDRWRSTL